MLSPGRRWEGVGEKPDYAGLPTFGGLPYSEDPADLAGADAAILGAPMDDLVSDRPGTRFGPRAIRMASVQAGAHLEARVDPLTELSVIDFGDAPVVPADAARSHAAIHDTAATVLGAGATPIVLGGDHSITEPALRACAAVCGPLGLVHFDSHTDSAPKCFGVELSHGTPMYRLLQAGCVDPVRYVQIGLRGYWPEQEVFEWQHQLGITSYFMHDVLERGVGAVLAETIDVLGGGPAYLTVDIDVLDPAFAPGTGTPEPGGMSSLELLAACRRLASELELVGADVVEVSPAAHGTADITALAGARIVHEILTGLALHRSRRGAQSYVPMRPPPGPQR